MKKLTTKRIITIAAIILILGLIVFQLIRNKKKIDEGNKQTVDTTTVVSIPVNVMTIGLESVDNEMVKTGTLMPNKEADINAMNAGKLTSVNFQLGSYVGQGATVARIDNGQTNISIDAAILQRDQAKIEYDRARRLYEGDAGTLAAMQQAKLQYDNSLKNIQQLSKQSSDYYVKAPISGQIVSKLKEPGEFVSPGAILGRIVDISQLKVSVMVTDKEVYTIRLGQSVKVKTDIYPEAEYTGKVTFISNEGDASHNFPVEVTIPNNRAEKLKAGSFAYVDFYQGSAGQYITIPRSALIESLNRPVVYVVNKEMKVEERAIILGKDFGDYLEVIDGLEPGDQIVTSGLINIRNGSLVKPIEATVTVK